MGLLHKVEDRPTPSSVYNWRVYLSAAVAGSAAVMIGYDSAFIGGTIALDSFKAEFGLDHLSKSAIALKSANIVSCYQAGAFFGAFFAYPFAYFYGRKKALSIFAAIFCLGAGLMLGANRHRGLGLIYGGRVIAGAGVGGTSMISPIYISEVSPPAIRGRLVGFYEFSWQIGGLVGFWINVRNPLANLKRLLTVWQYGLTQTMAPSHKQWLIVSRALLFKSVFADCTLCLAIRCAAHSSGSSLRRRLPSQGIAPLALYQKQT
jgi:MFS family permease